ncbi:MAG TPA: hypothetical protein DDZ80_10660, partial [Cyanobacteria bacterium UBA8803]|nr:hypothetical protein [Cyanobacteria bacterium UBA8803]
EPGSNSPWYFRVFLAPETLTSVLVPLFFTYSCPVSRSASHNFDEVIFVDAETFKLLVFLGSGAFVGTDLSQAHLPM